MFYDLTNPMELRAAEARFNFLVSKGKRITLVEKRKKRTYQQNRYLHLLLGWFAIETGFSLLESKHLYKLQSKEIFIYTKKGVKFVRSSADLNTEEMTLSIERFRDYSNTTAGIYLPAANENELLNNIENELSRYENKVYI